MANAIEMAAKTKLMIIKVGFMIYRQKTPYESVLLYLNHENLLNFASDHKYCLSMVLRHKCEGTLIKSPFPRKKRRYLSNWGYLGVFPYYELEIKAKSPLHTNSKTYIAARNTHERQSLYGSQG